jgi:sugar transferase (PEP-CTERM/EpsH1 system associated)
MRSSLLVLAHRIPYPPNKGDKVRSFQWIRGLATSHRVHLGAFVDDPLDWEGEAQLRQFCASVYLRPLRRHLASIRSLRGLWSRAPLTLPYYADAHMRRWVADICREETLAAVLVYSSSMAQYVSGDLTARTVLDMVDVDSDKWRQYSGRRRGPMRWLYAREARLLRDYEAQLVTAFDCTLLVSAAEVAFLRGRLGPEGSRVRELRNGVDTEYFRPDRPYPDPLAGARRALVFTGAMDYWANVDAVQWFAREVLPRVARLVPDVQFWIVGANPSREVYALCADPRVHVTGRVADVRPYLAHARAAVAPLRIARGVQNKVLEAMAMARPVFATPAAVRGISETSVPGIRVAEDPDEAAKVTSALLHSTSSEEGSAGRAFVVTHFSWQASLLELEALLDGATQRREPAPRFGSGSGV